MSPRDRDRCFSGYQMIKVLSEEEQDLKDLKKLALLELGTVVQAAWKSAKALRQLGRWGTRKQGQTGVGPGFTISFRQE